MLEFGWRSKRGYPLLDKDNNFTDEDDLRLMEEIIDGLGEKGLEESYEIRGVDIPSKFNIIKNMLPKFMVTNDLGVLDSEERKKFDNFFSSIIKGTDVEQRIISLINGLNEVKVGKNIVDITKNLVMLETINNIFSSFNAQTVGYIMESMLAFISGGKRIELNTGGVSGSETSIVDFEEGDKKYSLKTIAKNTKIHGSLNLLYNEIISKGINIRYIVIYKNMSQKNINGLEFNYIDINSKNYERVLDNNSVTRIKNLLKGKLGEEILVEENREKTQFEIVGKLNKIGTLNLDRSIIMNTYKEYLLDIEKRFSNIYISLNNFQVSLLSYFSSNSRKRRELKLGDRVLSDSKEIPQRTKESKLGDL